MRAAPQCFPALTYAIAIVFAQEAHFGASTGGSGLRCHPILFGGLSVRMEGRNWAVGCECASGGGREGGGRTRGMGAVRAALSSAVFACMLYPRVAQDTVGLNFRMGIVCMLRLLSCVLYTMSDRNQCSYSGASMPLDDVHKARTTEVHHGPARTHRTLGYHPKF